MMWLVVYLGYDAPEVIGPFESEELALKHILDRYINEGVAANEDEARERYTTTGSEWVTTLIPSPEHKEGP